MKPRAGDSLLDVTLAKVTQSSQALADLTWVWPDTQAMPFWWDNYFRVFATIQSRSTSEGLFGTYRTARALLNPRKRASHISNARRILTGKRLKGPVHLGAALPSDSVVLPPERSKNGVAVASRNAGLLLKVTYDREGVAKELESWDIARSAGIEKHLPATMDHGSTGDGGRWVLNEFVPNTDPPDRPLNPFADRGRTWLDWLRWKILPFMERFYEASGLEVDEADTSLEVMRSTFVQDGMPQEVIRIIDLAENALSESRRTTVVTATIHKDLIPRHLHRHGGAWWIIDWGSTGRGITCKDFFREYFWRSLPGDPKHRAFWAWLRGDVPADRLPGNLSSEITVYLDWYSAWRRVDMDPGSLRFQLLLAFLGDYHDVITQYDLKDRLRESETSSEFPALARILLPQFRALGVMGDCG